MGGDLRDSEKMVEPFPSFSDENCSTKHIDIPLPSHIDTEVARNCRKSCNNVPRLDGDFFTDLQILGHKL